MAENSKISWCNHTFNPWVGCEKVSPACENCYAEGWAKRTGSPGLWAGDEPRRTSDANWKEPIKWNRKAEAAGQRQRVFCASLADVFDNRVPWQWREDLWTLITETTFLDWLILTKRPENFTDMLPGNYPEGMLNVWLGVTVENREQAERRIPILQSTSASVRFLSCEPLLEDITPLPILRGGVDWIICGGESGGTDKLMPYRWAEQLLLNSCTCNAKFFMKQMGAVSDRISKSSGVEIDEEWGFIPPHLRVREFPGGTEGLGN